MTEAAAAREGLTVAEYLVRFFSEANWLAWLALMMTCSVSSVLGDSHVAWRVVRWFNVPGRRLTDMLPIRASVLFLPRANRASFGGQAGARPVDHGGEGGGHQQPGEGGH